MFISILDTVSLLGTTHKWRVRTKTDTRQQFPTQTSRLQRKLSAIEGPLIVHKEPFVSRHSSSIFCSQCGSRFSSCISYNSTVHSVPVDIVRYFSFIRDTTGCLNVQTYFCFLRRICNNFNISDLIH